ncbi:MAG: hypothetical protein ABR587_10765 [Candidatus Binatia bacterium]
MTFPDHFLVGASKHEKDDFGGASLAKAATGIQKRRPRGEDVVGQDDRVSFHAAPAKREGAACIDPAGTTAEASLRRTSRNTAKGARENRDSAASRQGSRQPCRRAEAAFPQPGIVRRDGHDGMMRKRQRRASFGEQASQATTGIAIALILERS